MADQLAYLRHVRHMTMPGRLEERYRAVLVATTAEPLADAHEHATARADMKPVELLMMANTIATVAEFTPGAGERLLDIAFDGITPR
ncbi:hypothetical protein [Streptomyces phaeolivaceus]|uniref:hypothetical protein n=1 Tax=Streptomyces phaeolivaceus TaxID=2653200 RepID=UPI0018697390|nr:hypothetical protein [Streptomyces phaeolivaceus]